MKLLSISIASLAAWTLLPVPAMAQEKWAPPKIDGYANVTESQFPDYHKNIASRPSIELIAAYLPKNKNNEADLDLYKKSGKQIVISTFPMKISKEQFSKLGQVLKNSTGHIQNRKQIDLGGRKAKVLDLVVLKNESNEKFATAMTYEFLEPQPLHSKLNAVTMHCWYDGNVFRFEYQEPANAENSVPAMQKRVETIRKRFEIRNELGPKKDRDQ